MPLLSPFVYVPIYTKRKLLEEVADVVCSRRGKGSDIERLTLPAKATARKLCWTTSNPIIDGGSKEENMLMEDLYSEVGTRKWNKNINDDHWNDCSVWLQVEIQRSWKRVAQTVVIAVVWMLWFLLPGFHDRVVVLIRCLFVMGQNLKSMLNEPFWNRPYLGNPDGLQIESYE